MVAMDDFVARRHGIVPIRKSGEDKFGVRTFGHQA
jgi:hypothetical protein